MELYTTKQVAEILQMSTYQIVIKAKKREIPGAIKIGRDWRFEKELFENWLTKKEGGQ